MPNQTVCIKNILYPTKPLDLIETIQQDGTNMLILNGIQEVRFKSVDFLPSTVTTVGLNLLNIIGTLEFPTAISLNVPTIIYNNATDGCKAYKVILSSISMFDINNNEIRVLVIESSDGCYFSITMDPYLRDINGDIIGMANFFDGCEFVILFKILSFELTPLCIDPVILDCNRIKSSCNDAWQWRISYFPIPMNNQL